MTTDHDQALAWSLRDLIIGLGIPPQTTLSATATLGVSPIVLQVADASHFPIGGRAGFLDALQEELLPIVDTDTTVTPQTVTLDTTALGYTGLQHTHTRGTIVYTNIQSNAPATVGPKLVYGDPCIFILALSERKRRVSVGNRMQSTYTFRIQYHRLLDRPENQRMDPDVWSDRQQAAARSDLGAISSMIQQNPRLQVANQEQAQALGEPGQQGAPLMTKSWQKLTAPDDTDQFVAVIDVVVQAAFDPPTYR